MLIWNNSQTRSRLKIDILSQDEKYTFKYVNLEDVNRVYESKELFANIETRLPNHARADYLSILNSYNLEINSSKFDILKSTKGRLITDNYEFVHVLDKNKIEFDVDGTRHCDDIKRYKDLICINDKLLLELDSDYVPRYYTAGLTELLKKQCSILCNGTKFEF